MEVLFLVKDKPVFSSHIERFENEKYLIERSDLYGLSYSRARFSNFDVVVLVASVIMFVPILISSMF